jgi:hypothetical protein
MTRDTIRGRVAAYLDRTDLNVKIKQWIEDTRMDLALKYPFKFLYAEATASTVNGTSKYAMPLDYLGHSTFWCGSKKMVKLAPREFDELTLTDVDAAASPRELSVEPGTSTNITSIGGPPDYYIERGMEFELYPTPDATYTLRIKYYASPTPWTTDSTTTDDTQTDYITTFHYDAVIWGTALRGAIYLDDEVKKQNFAAVYNTSVQEMIKREKDFEVEDQHPRMKSWTEFDLTTFKRSFRLR